MSKPKMKIIFVDWRLGRIIMFIMITGSVAFGFGASLLISIVSGVIGALLSASGFYLDYLGDYRDDRESGKLSNPIAKGAISPRSTLLLIITFLLIVSILSVLINISILIPMIGVILIIIGLNQGILNTPLLRAFCLGALQGLYVIIGALAAEKFELDVIFVSLFLFLQ